MADAERGPIAIICGGGSFPGAVAEAIVRRGRQPVMFAIKGWADAKVVERYPHHWIAVGQLGRFFRLAQAAHCKEVLFIGTLLRPPLKQVRLDWQTIRLLPRIAGFFRGGDNRLLSGAASIAESGGLRVIGVRDVAPEIFVPEGVLGRCQPVGARSQRHRAGDETDRCARPVRRRPGRDRRQQPRTCRRGGGRHRQYAGAHRRSAPAGPRHHAVRRRRSGQGAKTRPGSPLRSAFDRAANNRGCGARRACRRRRRRRLNHHRRGGRGDR